MYKDWLYYTCKWATKGLDGIEFQYWQHLSTKLDKHCPRCAEGQVCISCRDSGLKLTDLEKTILGNIEKSLDSNHVHSVQ